MLVLGILLILVGFVFIMPRGGVSGSAAVRNIDLGVQGIHETPGYQERNSRRGPTIRIVLSVALIAAGIALVAVA